MDLLFPEVRDLIVNCAREDMDDTVQTMIFPRQMQLLEVVRRIQRHEGDPLVGVLAVVLVRLASLALDDVLERCSEL